MHWYSMSVFIQVLLKPYYVPGYKWFSRIFSSGEITRKWVVHKDNSSTFVEYLLDAFTEKDGEMSGPLLFPHHSLSSPLEIRVPFSLPSMLPAGGTLGFLWTKPSVLGERYQAQFSEEAAVMSRREGQPGGVAWSLARAFSTGVGVGGWSERIYGFPGIPGWIVQLWARVPIS